MNVDGDDGVVAQMQTWLRSRPALADIDVQRGRPEVRPGELGATEVLTFLATEVSLPLILNAIYDFFRSRRRSRPAEKGRVVLTRIDLPGGLRRVELTWEGSAEDAVKIVQAALEDPGTRD